MDNTLAVPGNAKRYPYEPIPTMSRNDQILIEDIADLLATLAKSRVTVEWHIPPEAEHHICLSPSQLQILVDGKPITSCRIGNLFKQFVCTSIGEIEHTQGTTYSAHGSLKLSTFNSDRMLDIDYDCSESPAVVGSLYGGGSLISVSLTDFLLENQSGG